MCLGSLKCHHIINSLNAVDEHNAYSIKGDYSEGNTNIRNLKNYLDLYAGGGNYIEVPSQSNNYVVYKDNCMTGAVNDQRYSMHMNKSGFSVTLFDTYIHDTISIGGRHSYFFDQQTRPRAIGTGSFQIKGWKGFWKTATGGKYDITEFPGLNHLWVTNAPSASHVIPNGRNPIHDDDILNNVNGYTVIYIMWGNQPHYISSVMHLLVTSIAGGKFIKHFFEYIISYSNL